LNAVWLTNLNRNEAREARGCATSVVGAGGGGSLAMIVVGGCYFQL